MAQNVIIDIPGIGQVEAKNAATEHTLNEILKIMQKFDKQTNGGKKPMGASGGDAAAGPQGAGNQGGGGAGAGKSMGMVEKAGYALGKSFKNLGSFMSSGTGLFLSIVDLAGVGLGKIAGVATYVAGALTKLALSAAQIIAEFANVEDIVGAAQTVNKALSSLPGPLGALGGFVGGIMVTVAQAATKVVKAYQEASASGATFGGSLNQFAASASAAGMTMAEFGKIIAQNGNAMVLLGGTTEEGAKRFADMSKNLRQSQLGTQLLALGYSTEQVNQGMASYAKSVGYNGSLQGKTTAQLAAGAGAYLKEMDALAKITGQTREEKEKEMEQLAKDAQFAAATANMDAEERKNLMAFIGSFPPAAQGAVKDMIATGTASSEESQKFATLMGGTSQEVMKYGQVIKQGGHISKQALDQTHDNAVAEAKIAAKSQTFQTLGSYAAQDFGHAVSATAELAQQDVGARKKALTEQEKVQANTASQLEQFNQQIKAMANGFQMALVQSGVLSSIMTMFNLLAGIVTQFLIPAFGVAVDIITKYVVPGFAILFEAASEIAQYLAGPVKEVFEAVAGFIQDTLYPAFLTIAGYIMADVVPALQDIGSVIKEYVWPAMKSIGETIADYVTPVFRAVANYIANNLTPILLGVAAGLLLYGTYLAVTTAATFILNGGLITLGSAVIAAAAPFIAIAIPVIAMVALFKHLYDTGWTFGSAIEALQDNFERFGMAIEELIDNLKSKFSLFMSDDDKKAMEKRAQERDARRKELDEKEAKRTEKRAEVAGQRAEDMQNKDQKRAEASAAVDNKIQDVKAKGLSKLQSANAKEEKALDDKAKLAEQQQNLDDPVQMLKDFAKNNNSGFIKEPEKTAIAKPSDSTQVAQADATKKQLTEKADAEKAAATKAEADKKAEAEKKSNGSGQTGPNVKPAQESAETLLASLNTKMDRLIKISMDTHSVNEKQVSVMQGMTGDLYSV